MSDKDAKLGELFLRVKVSLLGPSAWCGMCDSLLWEAWPFGAVLPS